MKKLLGLLLVVIGFALVGCQPQVTTDMLQVDYGDIYWEGDSVVVDITITNDTSDALFLDYIEFTLFMPDEETVFCEAGFNINEEYNAGQAIEYEVEFTPDYIFMTQSDLDTADVTLNDLVLWYYLTE